MLNIIQLNSENFFDKSSVLREKSESVTDFGSFFQNEVDELLRTFHNWQIAVGLSAPQIGIKKRFFVVNLSNNKSEPDLIIVNPIITNTSGKKDIKKESCLSLPNVRGNVERRYNLALTYLDRYGKEQNFSCEGFIARVVLHEIDHLDGILFVDRMTNGAVLEPLNIAWK
jgi:peptide deformylase